jgi:UDP-GlcNAc:undecaprenyl-phosphate GlcNAc-1-phosphate transferase
MLAPLCILAIPLYDICSVILIRLSEGRSPFQPDKKHFSHRLTEMGLSKRDAVLVVHLTTITTGLGALLLYRISDWTGAVLVLALVLCLLTIVAILETVGRSSTIGDAPTMAIPTPPPSKPEA